MKVLNELKARIRAFYYRFAAKNQGTISCSAFIGDRVVLEGKNSIGVSSKLTNTKLGYATYIANYSEFEDCIIGKYSSIGSHVRQIIGKHPSRGFISTHPAFYSVNHLCKLSYVKKQSFEELEYADDQHHSLIIGNDVWIGDNVLLKGGIKIGDGAIVAAGAVVMRDVAPYTIVGGVPARQIRMRFLPEQIEKLQMIRWWERDEAWLAQHVDVFHDIDTFIAQNGGR